MISCDRQFSLGFDLTSLHRRFGGKYHKRDSVSFQLLYAGPMLDFPPTSPTWPVHLPTCCANRAASACTMPR